MGQKFDNWADGYAAQQFGSGLLGDMTEEEKKRLRMQAMGAFGAGLLDAGGWSRTPTTLGQGVAAGYNNAANTYANGENAVFARRQMQAEESQRLQREQARQQLVAKYRDGQLQEADVLDMVSRDPSLSNLGTQMIAGLRGKDAGEPRVTTIRGVDYMHNGKTWEPVAKPSNGLQEWAGQFQSAFGRAPSEAELQRKFGVVPQSAKPSKSEELRGRRETWETDIAPMLAEQAGVTPELLTKARNAYIITGDFEMKLPGEGKGEKDESKGNARQQSGRANRNAAVVNYTAQLVGMKPEEIAAMEPDEVGALVREKGGRFTDGGVARLLSFAPWVGDKLVDTANPDLAPYVEQMAGGQVNVNNPAGDVSEQAFALAKKQVPGPTQDLAIQAQMIVDLLKDGRGASAKTAPAARPTPEQAMAELERRKRARGQ